MKEHPTYEPVPEKLIQQAASPGIAAYLMAQGEQQIPAGQSRYKLADHDSLVITGSMYYWNSRKESGNAIKFLCSYYGMGFREAVESLLASGTGTNIILLPAAPELPPRPFDFADIDLAADTERVIDYLTNTRGLSRLLVDELINHRRLFQDADAVCPRSYSATISFEACSFLIFERLTSMPCFFRWPQIVLQSQSYSRASSLALLPF